MARVLHIPPPILLHLKIILFKVSYLLSNKSKGDWQQDKAKTIPLTRVGNVVMWHGIVGLECIFTQSTRGHSK